MISTKMEVHLAIDHGGDDEVVMVVCGALEKVKRDLEARKMVRAVTVNNTTRTEATFVLRGGK